MWCFADDCFLDEPTRLLRRTGHELRGLFRRPAIVTSQVFWVVRSSSQNSAGLGPSGCNTSTVAAAAATVTCLATSKPAKSSVWNRVNEPSLFRYHTTSDICIQMLFYASPSESSSRLSESIETHHRVYSLAFTAPSSASVTSRASGASAGGTSLYLHQPRTHRFSHARLFVIGSVS